MAGKCSPSPAAPCIDRLAFAGWKKLSVMSGIEEKLVSDSPSWFGKVPFLKICDKKWFFFGPFHGLLGTKLNCVVYLAQKEKVPTKTEYKCAMIDMHNIYV